ncbi:Crp/Fnr family transcriptional regulator [Dinghuibacter silviterrae]|uniref:CRP-like cAMP-binding protein n=1 Tax=Dinghuibacter silviterrae TaxID=1539049 RepID=A0A4R8DT02_9BACT|nr:Crp/Fnr family transcriptional regulator [Dinghuibacter silviterrae]TDX01219.1 CRP-like cAMP-binding protein [Dinghuibacter silviterrae]
MEDLVEFLKRVGPEYFLEPLRPHIRTKHLKKSEYLARAGTVFREMYFVKKGGCVMYYLEGGKEVVTQFFFEGELMCDHYSFLTGRPSNQFVRMLEDTTVESLDDETIRQLYDEIPGLERISRLLTERTCVRLMFTLASHKNDSAEVRYRKLLIQRPQLFQRVPQYLIASYLGITPVGLSKVRKRLSGNPKGGSFIKRV